MAQMSTRVTNHGSQVSGDHDGGGSEGQCSNVDKVGGVVRPVRMDI